MCGAEVLDALSNHDTGYYGGEGGMEMTAEEQLELERMAAYDVSNFIVYEIELYLVNNSSFWGWPVLDSHNAIRWFEVA